MTSYQLNVASCSSPETARNDRKLILSVDDELSVLRTRYKLLDAAGYAVFSACDGAQALDICGQHKVDLVLLDYALPGMDGGMLAEVLKTYMPDLLVVMVSAAQVPEQCLSICDGHVQKGNGPEPLLHAIRQLLSPSSKQQIALSACKNAVLP